MAVADTHTMSSDGLGVQPFFCGPSKLDSDSVIDLVKTKLKQKDSHQYSAASVVLEALMRFYPCGKPQ